MDTTKVNSTDETEVETNMTAAEATETVSDAEVIDTAQDSEINEEAAIEPMQDSEDEPVDDDLLEEDSDKELDEGMPPVRKAAASRKSSDSPETNRALDMMQLENMIHTQLSDISKIREETKELKSMFDDAFKNDATFKDLDEKAKDVAKKRNTYKTAMLKDPAVAQANQQYLAKKDELKDMQSALSDYLREYARSTGLNQFETADGDILEIVQTFKLVRK
jgi:hypothetical protein